MGVQIWTPRRQENGVHTIVLEQRIKRLREFGVPIVDEIAFAQEEPLEGIGQLPGALLHKGGSGMRRDARDLDTPCAQLHHHEDIIGHESMPRSHLHRKEVGRGQDLPVHLQELCPTHPGLAALWSRLHMVAAQDVAHGDLVDRMPQIGQRTLDAPITPGGVLLGHLDGEPLDLLGHRGPPSL